MPVEVLDFHKVIPRWDQNVHFLTLRETTSIHFTFIWEDPLPQECLAHDHAQRAWFQKYLVNQSREGFPVTMYEKKRIVLKIKLVAEPWKWGPKQGACI